MTCFKSVYHSFVALLLLLLPAMAVAQPQPVTNADLPYFEGFEKSDVSDWYLNVVDGSSEQMQNIRRRQLGDHWYHSSAEHYQGNKCLLISDTVTKGTAAVYGGKSAKGVVRNVVVAYREFQLKQGDYKLNFAWRCYGESKRSYVDQQGQPQIDDDDKLGDGLYVAWLPAASPLKSSNLSVDGTPDFQKIKNAHRVIKGDEIMYRHSQFWKMQDATISVPADGSYRLYFIWNNDGDDYWREEVPSACIDNIQLDTVRPQCATPTDIKAVMDAGDVTLTWKGSAQEYEVCYRMYGEANTEIVRPNPKGNSITIPEMKEGLYNFFVRAICGAGDTSAYATSDEVLVFDNNAPGRCIPFDELDKYECGWKQLGGSGAGAVDYENAKFDYKTDIKKGGWNFGSDDIRSKHTVHTHPGEVDRRVRKLKTIPDGEVMSVRLGSWETQGNIQYIDYTFDVSPMTTQVLYVKYAIVLEAPFDDTHFNPNNPNDMSAMPMFTVEILDGKTGNPLGGDCGFREYYATPNADGWETVIINDNGDSAVFRNWTTAAINLSAYKNPSGPDFLKPRPIIIKFTTHDCEPAGHYGYAYFTLRCEELKGEGLMCGNEPTAKLKAPAGFEYEWYLPENTTMGTPNEKPDGTAQEFEVQNPQLKQEYTCVLKSVDKPGCEDVIKYQFNPRQPRSKFAVTQAQHDCKNIYRFTDGSAIIKGEDETPTGDKPSYYEWDFGDGSPVAYERGDIEHEFPAEGGTFSVKLTTSINDNSCAHDTTVVIEVPAIKKDPEVIDTTICQGNVFILPRDPDKKPYTKSDTIEYDFNNVYGCNEKVTVYLTVVDSLVTELYDTICQGETYEKEPFKISKPVTNRYRWQLQSSGGCDSVIYLNLNVIDSVRYEGAAPEICGDDATFDLNYSLVAGKPAKCVVEFGEKAKNAGFTNFEVEVDTTALDAQKIEFTMPADVRPDHYSATLKFTTERCGDFVVPFDFTVNYPVSVVRQKWNDVLALKNKDNNNGYTFSAYQWYKNGVAIAGATASYLYIGADGTEFDAADEYSVRLVREGEAVQIFTCPIIPEKREPLTEFIGLQSSATVGQKVAVRGVAEGVEAQWFGMDGRLVSVQHVEADELTAPLVPGIYMLRLLPEGEMLTFKVVVK